MIVLLYNCIIILLYYSSGQGVLSFGAIKVYMSLLEDTGAITHKI